MTIRGRFPMGDDRAHPCLSVWILALFGYNIIPLILLYQRNNILQRVRDLDPYLHSIWKNSPSSLKISVPRKQTRQSCQLTTRELRHIIIEEVVYFLTYISIEYNTGEDDLICQTVIRGTLAHLSSEFRFPYRGTLAHKIGFAERRFFI